jgi:PHP family Zn ribbon phosphoesterase
MHPYSMFLSEFNIFFVKNWGSKAHHQPTVRCTTQFKVSRSQALAWECVFCMRYQAGAWERVKYCSRVSIPKNKKALP